MGSSAEAGPLPLWRRGARLPLAREAPLQRLLLGALLLGPVEQQPPLRLLAQQRHRLRRARLARGGVANGRASSRRNGRNEGLRRRARLLPPLLISLPGALPGPVLQPAQPAAVLGVLLRRALVVPG